MRAGAGIAKNEIMFSQFLSKKELIDMGLQYKVWFLIFSL